MPYSLVFRQIQYLMLNFFALIALAKGSDWLFHGTVPTLQWGVALFMCLLMAALSAGFSEKEFREEIATHRRIITGQMLEDGMYFHIHMPSWYVAPTLLGALMYVLNNGDTALALYMVALVVARLCHSLDRYDAIPAVEKAIGNGSLLRTGHRRMWFEDGWRIEVSSLNGRVKIWEPDTPELRKKLRNTCDNLLGRANVPHTTDEAEPGNQTANA